MFRSKISRTQKGTFAVCLCANKFTTQQIVGYVKKRCKEDPIDALNAVRRRLGLEVVEREESKVAIENGREVKRQKVTEEDEIMMDRTIRFKFRCPITKLKIKIPVKGFY